MTDDLKIVCLLDVLGFEGILKDIGLGEMERRYDDLIAYVQQQTGGLDIQPTPDGHVAVGWLELGNAGDGAGPVLASPASPVPRSPPTPATPSAGSHWPGVRRVFAAADLDYAGND